MRVKGLGFRVKGFGFRVAGIILRALLDPRVYRLGILMITLPSEP